MLSTLLPDSASAEAEDDTFTITAGSTDNVLDVLDNDDLDDDDDDDPFILDVSRPSEGGDARLGEDRDRILYTPPEGFTGTERFRYTLIYDGFSRADVTVHVIDDNTAPVAVDDAYAADEDTALNVDAGDGVLSNDTDEDADALTATLVDDVENGSLTLNDNGSFSYMPAPEFSGTDAFTYRASDGTESSNTATVEITVSSVDDPPVITSTPDTTAREDELYVYEVVATDDEVEPAITAPTLPPWLSFDGVDTISGTPDADDAGTHDVTVAASDGTNDDVQQSFELRVESVDDPPIVATIPEQNATVGIPFELELLDFVSDEDTSAEELRFSARGSLPAGFSLSTQGRVSGTPGTNAVGSQRIRFRVRDASSQTDGRFDLVVSDRPRADLGVTISATPNPASLGTTVTWEIIVTNDGGRAEDVALEGVFRGVVPFRFDDAGEAGCSLEPLTNETALSCSLGELPSGESTTVQLTGSGNQAGDVLGTVSVASTRADEQSDDNAATTALSLAQEVVDQHAQTLDGFNAYGLAAGDLDGDGYDDLAVATDAGAPVLVFWNGIDPENSDKRVLATPPVPVGASVHDNDIAIGDLDGDSDLDLVTAGAAGHASRVFLNDGSGGFETFTLDDAARDSRAVAIGDVDGDGFADLVFANASPNSVYLSTGIAGEYAPPLEFGNDSSVAVAVADLYGDTRPELVFARADGDALVYRFAEGGLELAATLPTGAATSVTARDVNGDGAVDLLFGRDTAPQGSALPSNPVFSNTSAATPDFFASDELGAAPTFAVLTADADFDGDHDAIVLNTTSAHQVFTNAGNSSNAFILAPAQFTAARHRAAALGRFSVDDRPDLVIAGEDGADILFNDGTGRYGAGDRESPTITLIGEAAVTLEIGETYEDAGATATDVVDGDLTDDIVVDNPVDTSIVGTYVVSYNAMDSSGNRADTVTRSVQVGARAASGGGGGGAFGLPALIALLGAAWIRGRVRVKWRAVKDEDAREIM